MTHCLVCKKFTDNADSRTVKIKGRLMIKPLCTVCGNKKSRFISQKAGPIL